MINSYNFGVIIVDGQKFTKDLIISPSGVISNWWRKEGHRLLINDLTCLLDLKNLKVLIVGTGYHGFLRVPIEINQLMEQKGIELFVQPTTKACETYNNLIKSKSEIAAALHLTC